MKTILLTRPKESSLEIASQLSKKEYQIVIEPLFEIKKLQVKYPRNSKIHNLQAILITSSNAIFSLQEILNKKEINKEILIFAVGNNTALKIKDLGFKNIIIANNSAFDILQKAITILNRNKGEIIYLSGSKITLNLTQELTKYGFKATRIIVYKTSPINELSTKVIEFLKMQKIDEIWIYSQNTMRIFYHLALKHKLITDLENVKIAVLSNKISNYAKNLGFKNVKII